MEPPPARSTGRSAGPGVRLIVAFVLVLLATVAASAARGASDEPAERRPDPAAAHDEIDPRLQDLPGWYTPDQAARGMDAYAEHCAECHSPDLRARSAYISLYAFPALTGAYFWDRWGGQSVHSLLLVIQETMPLHAPGMLDGQEYADITAYILNVNGFPAGERELPPAGHDMERVIAMPIEPDFARPLARARDVDRPPTPEPVEPEPVEPEPVEPEPEEEAPRDGWFTQAQVERARVPYFVHCSRCHGSALEGRGVAPSLAGPNFMERWDGESVADLYWVVWELMPLDDQGALDRRTAADLVAYILSQNDFETGDGDLPADEERLEQYVIGEEDGG